MKTAVIGANGSVASELCCILRGRAIDVQPIVRNKVGAAYLRHMGFSCTIAEISNEADAKEALHDIDVVVIAAYAWPDLTSSPKQHAALNEALVKNAVAYAGQNATVIYFSTIRALSRKIDANTSFLRPLYDKEKEHLEKVLLHWCKKYGKKGYALRLGHVFGQNQPFTKKVNELLVNAAELHLQTNPEQPSNIVHTVTIAEAITRCATSSVRPGTYTLVNVPQWTWRDVFEHYNTKKIPLMFMGKKKETRDSWLNDLKQMLVNIAGRQVKHYLRLRQFMPKSLEEYAKQKYLRKKIADDIALLKKNDQSFYASPFSYATAPGPYLPGLSKTADLLKKQVTDL